MRKIYFLWLNDKPYGRGDISYMSELITDYLRTYGESTMGGTKFEIKEAFPSGDNHED